MPLDPTVRNENPFLFRTGIRTVQKLVLALTIHGQKISIVKPARASFTVRTGLALPFQGPTGTKAHRNNELRLPTPPKQRLIIAMPPYTRAPSLVKVQVRSSGHIPSARHGSTRGAIALHSPASSGQHRSPVYGPTPVPCPYEFEQWHEESGGTDLAVWYDPFLTQSIAAKKVDCTPSSCKAPRENQTPDHAVFSIGVHPIQLVTFLPHPGYEVPKSRDGR